MKRKSVTLLVFAVLLIGVVCTIKANKDVECNCECGHVSSTEKEESDTSSSGYSTTKATTYTEIEYTTKYTTNLPQTNVTITNPTGRMTSASTITPVTTTTITLPTTTTTKTIPTTTTLPTTPMKPTYSPMTIDTTTIAMEKSTNAISTTTTKDTKNATVPCSKFNYVLKNANTGVACAQTNMTIRMYFNYVMKDSRTGKATLVVPKETRTTGICGEKITEMTLNWKESIENQANVDDDKENKITFHYIYDNKFFIDFISIDVYLDDNNFPYAQHKRMTGSTANLQLRVFPISTKRGAFINNTETKINVNDQIDVAILDLIFTTFSECSKTDKKNVTEPHINIAAVVGGIIGGIILILIISFLIWRKKKKDIARSENLPTE